MHVTEIAEKVRALFLAKPGLVATEERLVEKFGLSRTPIRGALLQLEHDGLIIRKRSGISLRKPDPKEIADLYDMRALLEGYAAATVVKTGALTTCSYKRLTVLAHRYEKAVDIGRKRQMVNASIEFHALVIEISNNQLLRQIWQRCAFQSRVVHLAYAIPQTMARVDSNPWPHGRLAEVLRHGSSDEAEHAFREHLLDSRKHLLQKLTGITI